jgi:hypothetical protein
VTATEMFLLPSCEIRSETQRTKRPDKRDKNHQRLEKQKNILRQQARQNEYSARTKSSKLHLTRSSRCKLLFPSTAAAIDFAPSSPIWLSPCTADIRHHAPRSNKSKFSRRKILQTSSHKAQYLQAAVSFHGCCNRFCAFVADLVIPLHSRHQTSRTTIKNKQIQQAGAESFKLHLTRSSSRKLLFPSMAAAIDFAPSSPIWLLYCTADISAGAEQHTARGKYTAAT